MKYKNEEVLVCILGLCFAIVGYGFLIVLMIIK